MDACSEKPAFRAPTTWNGTAQKPLAHSVQHALRLHCKGLWLAALMMPLAAQAQTFSTLVRGTITTPLSVDATSGNTQIQGSATLAPTSGNALTVSGGYLAQFNTQVETPGVITVTTTSGTGIQATYGTVDVPFVGLVVNTNNGIGLIANSISAAAPALITIDDGATVNVNSSGVALGAYGSSGAINATDVLINLNGGNGRGVVAQAGGSVTLSGSSAINSSGAGSTALALGAANAGSIVNVTAPMQINLNSPGAMGVYMYGGGLVQLPANQVFNFNTGTGSGGVGMVVDGTQAPASALGSGLTFHFNVGGAAGSTGSTGVVVTNGGSVTLNGLVVDGANASTGVWATRGGSATLSGGNLTLTASGNPSYRQLSNATLLAPGSGAIGPTYSSVGAVPGGGLRVDGGTITADGTTIDLSSNNYSVGAYAISGSMLPGTTTYAPAVLNLSNVTMNVTGPSVYGLFVGDGGQANGQGLIVNANNAIGAMQLTNYGTRGALGTIDLSNSKITATGSTRYGPTAGLYSAIVAHTGQNVVTLTGTSLQSQGVAVDAVGPLLLTAQQGSTISGDESLLLATGNTVNQQQLTSVAFKASQSNLIGLAQADAVSTANITLSNQSTWVGKSFYVTNVNVDDTSEWTIPDSSIVAGQVLNNGLVQFTAPAGGRYKSLYTHDYAGTGTLGINTYLEDDTSPSDVLIIDGGTANGRGLIRVTNTGGPGALTNTGIAVVEVANGGATSADAFALSGPVIAGPYEYALERGGVTGAEDYWFLRSTFNCSSGIEHPGCPSPPGPPAPPPAPPPDPPPPTPPPNPPNPLPPDPTQPPVPPPAPAPPPVPDPVPEESGEAAPVVPNYRPEVSLYTALPGMALRFGWATLDNLHERVGEEAQLQNRSDLRGNSYLNAVWVRVLGEDGNVRGASQGIYNGSPQYDYNIEAFQVGMDVFAEEHENQQRDHAGVYLGTGRIRSDVTDYDGTDAGDDIVKGQSLGLYWTHFWAEGQYVDTVWQGTWSQYSSKSDEGLALHHDGFGWAASVEGGYPFHDDTQIWEPQAQVIYQRANSGEASDAAATVRFSNITSLVGRAGLRWANTWTLDPASNGSPRLFTGWLRFNVWKEFKGQPTTSFSSEDGFVPFDGSIKGSWWQLNGGMTWELDKNTSFYANLGYQKGFGSRGFRAWDGKVGMRWNW